MTYKDKAPSGVTKEIPQCTLRHFPSLIQHCIQWSKDSFYGYFGESLNAVKKFFNDLNEFKELLQREGSATFQLPKLEYLKKQIDIIVTKDIKKEI